MWFVLIPLELVCILLFGAVGLLSSAIDGLGEALPWVLAGAGVGLVLAGMHAALNVYRARVGGFLITLAEILAVLSLIPGAILFGELIDLDACGQWFTWFGDGVLARIFTLYAVLLLGSFLLLTLGAFLPPVVRAVPLLAAVALPVALFCNGLAVCTQSYACSARVDFSTEEALQECTVEGEAAVYFPSFRMGSRAPVLLPWKYTGEPFADGEVVYLLYPLEKAEAHGYAYIPVSDGERAGCVAVSQLRPCAEAVYRYSVQVAAESARVYACEEEVLATLQNGNTLTQAHRTDEVVAELARGQGLDVLENEGGWLRVRLETGTLGYVSCRDVAVERTPA